MPYRIMPVYDFITMVLFLLLLLKICHDFHYKPWVFGVYKISLWAETQLPALGGGPQLN